MLKQPFIIPFALRRFYSEGSTLDGAIDELRTELQTRSARFERLLAAAVFGSTDNPYRRLFDHAGCKPGDVHELLVRVGLDETLQELARGGMYLMPAEVRGRDEVVRGSLRFRLEPDDLHARHYFKRRWSPTFLGQTSGSTDAPTWSATSLAWQEREAPAFGAFIKAHALQAHRLAAYEPMLAGVSAGIQSVNIMVRLGVPLHRWFAREVPASGVLEAAYFRLTARQIAWTGRRYGPGYASPEPIGQHDIARITEWVEHERAAGFSTCIRAVASSCARIARSALESGTSLEGCIFLASGEPVTTAKRRLIEQSGASLTVLWGYEPGPVYVGLGCARPEHGDEMHVLTHSLAVVPHPGPHNAALAGSAQPLLFTTLYPSAARVQINVSNGDFATLSQRDCGCALHEAGLHLHVHGVGSFDKLTSQGLAYSREHLYELFETQFPDAFGGSPGDYQLIEEEDEAGRTFLTLCVAPEVGPVDADSLLTFLASELGRGSRSNRFAAELWKREGTFRIRRSAPIASSRGKVLPLRVRPRHD